MKRSARHAQLVVLLTTLVVLASACDPQASQAIGELGLQIYGGVAVGILTVILVVVGLSQGG